MIVFLWIAGILLGLILIWCILLLPRRNQPGWEKLAGQRYAHRGLHDAALPENSLGAFRAAVEAGFGAELDVHLMADGNLAVIHDSSLRRVCGEDAVIENLTAADLPNYALKGTAERIPLLEEVLQVFEGKTPLIIELKTAHGNAVPLTSAVMEQLRGWQGTYCIESFDPRVLLCLKRQYPAVLRGQLSQNFLRDKEGLPWIAQAAMTWLLTTVFTRPDFIAYHYKARNCLSLRLMRLLYGVHVAGWTIRDREALRQMEAEKIVPIF